MIYLVSTLFNQKFVITYFKLDQNVFIHHNVLTRPHYTI